MVLIEEESGTAKSLFKPGNSRQGSARWPVLAWASSFRAEPKLDFHDIFLRTMVKNRSTSASASVSDDVRWKNSATAVFFCHNDFIVGSFDLLVRLSLPLTLSATWEIIFNYGSIWICIWTFLMPT